MISPERKTPDHMLRSFILLMLLLACAEAFPQSRKEDLQRQREEINQQIALTRKLIRDSESQQKLTGNQLAILREQIRFRESLLQNINEEIHGIDSEIGHREQRVKSLEAQLEAMKREYGRMILNAYKSRSSYDRIMFIFSAQDFSQAYKRFKMTQRYAGTRKRQVEMIRKTQEELSVAISRLQTDRQEKEKLAQAKLAEKAEISRDKMAQERKLSALQKEERKLREQQKKQESDRKKLTRKIEEIIAAELAAERKKAEAGRATEASGGSSAPKAFELAPEVRLMNADFEKNRGSLPWPVKSGVITSRFGRHPHPTIAGIEIDSKGIDLATDRNSAILSVFAGKVTSVFSIPGAGNSIIITHGSYKSVYSGLDQVLVRVGDQVGLQQKIGTTWFNGEESILHFEVWKVSAEAGSAQNPELWISRR